MWPTLAGPSCVVPVQGRAQGLLGDGTTADGSSWQRPGVECILGNTSTILQTAVVSSVWMLTYVHTYVYSSLHVITK